MSRIKGKDTKPEKILRKWLWDNGYRYRLHKRELPGKPDIVFPGLKKAIFIHGCFWHRHNCKFFKWPATNTDFWKQKIGANVKRDKENYTRLQEINWRYMIVWECELREKEQNNILSRIQEFLKK